MILLERDAALNNLDRLLQDAATGTGRLVLVTGEAGVGKTSLIEEFSRRIAASALVLRGVCDPLSTPQALGPLRDIAESVAGDLDDLLRGAASRDQIFRAFLALLTERRQPVVVIIEDVHWADEATMDLLRFVGRRIGDRRSLLLVTYRDDEVGHHHPLRVVLGDLATSRAIQRLHLSPLGEGAVRMLAAGSQIDPVALHRQTGGNPFFVTEVLAAGSDHVPASVRDAVLARSARLSPGGRSALEAAAVTGAVVEPWLLHAAHGPDAASIEESVAIGMLRAQDAGYAFRHEITREAILSTIPIQRLTTLHRNILAALRASPAETPNFARLAHHAEGAADRQAVLEYAVAAARRAERLGSHREAAAQYARALRFSDQLPSADRAALLEQRAYECYLTDQHAEAMKARRAALEIWQGEGNRLKEGENIRWLSRLSWFLVRNTDAHRYGYEALAVLEGLPPSSQLAMAYSNLAQLHALANDHTAAITMGNKAIELAEQFDDIETLVHALNNVGTARLASDDERGRDDLERSLSMAYAAGLEEHVARALTNLASVAAEQHQFPLANRYLAEGIAYCNDHDLDSWRLYMLGWQAVSLLSQGDWSKAGEVATMVLGDPAVSPVNRIQIHVVLGRLRARRGDPEADRVLDEALALATPTRELQRLGPVRAARAEAAWLAGDATAAAAEARAGYDLADAQQHAWLAGQLVFWLWRVGELEHVPSYVAEPYRLQIEGNWRAAAECWRNLGCPYEEAQALADSDDPDVLRRTLQIFEGLGAQPMATRVTRRLRDLGVQGLARGPRRSTRANPANLTRREMEVLELLTEGLRNVEIAERLYLSPKTVDHHVSAVLGKLEASSRLEAARRAADLGIIVHKIGNPSS